MGASAAYGGFVARGVGTTEPVVATAGTEEVFTGEDVGLGEKRTGVELCGGIGLKIGSLAVGVEMAIADGEGKRGFAASECPTCSDDCSVM